MVLVDAIKAAAVAKLDVPPLHGVVLAGGGLADKS